MTTLQSRTTPDAKRVARPERVKSARTEPDAKSRQIPTEGRARTRNELPKTRVTKHALLLQLLSRPEGASIDEMMVATQWQQHSIRGFLAGTVKRQMGLTLTSSKIEGNVRRYRIAPRRGR